MTTRLYNDMLNEYLHYELLAEEAHKRMFYLNRVTVDNGWKGGTLPVPFTAARASSYSYGALTASNDIADYKFVRGSITSPKEIWGALKWEARDLDEHSSLEGQASGMVNEQSFLKDLPGKIEDFIMGMKEVASVNFLNGAHFATATADGTVGGALEVDHPERFEIGQKVVVEDAGGVETGYVSAINMATSVITLVTARGGATPVDLTGIDLVDVPRCYYEGANPAASTDAFTSLRSQLLSLANGGSATLFGQTKLSYPYLQASQHDGSSFALATILDDFFGAWTANRKVSKGQANELVVGYDKLAGMMKKLQSVSGPYRFTESKANVFGWTEISIVGVQGALKVVGVQEMDEDVAYIMDWNAAKVHSNGLFRIQKDPDGKAYFPVRAQSGYTYITDIKMFGENVVSKPSHCGVIYGMDQVLT